MGGDPWEPKGIPWEGTHGRKNPWEPKGSRGWGILGSPRDPMGGDPWEPKGSHGRGTLGSPRDPMGGDPRKPRDHRGSVWRQLGSPGTILEVLCDEVTFQEILKNQAFQVTAFDAIGAIGAQSMPGHFPTIGLLKFHSFFMQQNKKLRLADTVSAAAKPIPCEGTLGSPRDPLGGEPLGAQGIPWERTLGSPWTTEDQFGGSWGLQEPFWRYSVLK